MKLCGKGLHDLDDPAVAYIAPYNGQRRCGPCILTRARACPERRTSVANQARARAWRVANPERALSSARAWVAANRVRVHKNNSARRAANPAINAIGHARRRACIAQVLATLTAAEWEAILEAAGHACIYCGSQEQPSIDHLTPLSRGGDHTAENVAPACRPCNSQKHTKTVEEFLAEAS